MNHCESDDLFAQLDALLEYLGDGVFCQGVILGVHDRIVQIGVEFVAHITIDLYTRPVKIPTSWVIVISTPFL